MNTFSKLYDTELHNQEIKSNKRTLMGFCWFFLTLLLVWVLTMINFFLISKFLISLSLGFTVLLLIPPVIIYKKADLSSPWIKYLFLVLMPVFYLIVYGTSKKDRREKRQKYYFWKRKTNTEKPLEEV